MDNIKQDGPVGLVIRDYNFETELKGGIYDEIKAALARGDKVFVRGLPKKEVEKTLQTYKGCIIV